MSIDEILSGLEAEGKLVKFCPPRDPDEPELRQVWMMPALHRWFHEEGLMARERDRRADMRAFLSEFITGETMREKEDLKQVKPHNLDVWDFRFRFRPQSRLFGSFYAPDRFVCTNWALRGDLDKLGREGSSGWNSAIDKAVRKWNEIFPGRRPFRCSPLSQCITGAMDSWPKHK